MSAGQTATAPEGWRPIRLLERVEIQCRYLSTHFEGWAVPPRPTGREALITPTLEAPAKVLRDELCAPCNTPSWIVAFRGEALRELAAAEQVWLDAEAPGLGPEFVAVAGRISGRKYEPEQLPVGPRVLEIIVLLHNLVALQRELQRERAHWLYLLQDLLQRAIYSVWNRVRALLRLQAREVPDDPLRFRRGAPGGVVRELVRAGVDKIEAEGGVEPMPLDAGDRLSAFLALLAARSLLAGEMPAFVGNAAHADPWADVLEVCEPEVRRALLVLVGRAPEIAGASRCLRDRAKPLAASMPAMELAGPIRDQLVALEGFAAELCRLSPQSRGSVDPTMRGASAPGPRAIGARAAGGLRLLSSPTLPSDDPDRVREAVGDLLEEAALRLFESGAVPRLPFLREIGERVLREAVALEGEHLAPSQLLCRAAVAAASASAGGVSDDVVDGALEAVVDPTPTPGDMWSLHLLLRGLFVRWSSETMRAFVEAEQRKREGRPAQLDDSPIVPPQITSWHSLFGQDHEPGRRGSVRRVVLTLAARSPVAQVFDRELVGLLETESQASRASSLRPWQEFAAFFDDPDAAPLHDVVREELLQQTMSGDALPVLSLLKDAVAASRDRGGAFAARFVTGLFRRALGPDLEAAVARARRLHGRQGGGDEASLERFFFVGTPHSAALVELLCDILAAKQRLEASSAGGAAARELRSAWYEFCELGTRGLRDRPLDESPRRKLETFWLAFCARVHARGLGTQLAVDTSSTAWDDLSEVSAELWRRLMRARSARDRRKRHAERVAAHISRALKVPAPVPEHERVEDAEFARIGALLDSILGDPDAASLRRALLVRGLLVREGGEVVINPDKA